MIVVDASVIVDVLLRVPGADALDARIFGAGESLHAPHLIDVEVSHVLRRYALRGELSDARGKSALALLHRFPLTRHPHDVLLQRMWMLRHNLSAYDAAYVALAEGLDATLCTRDAPLASSQGTARGLSWCDAERDSPQEVPWPVLSRNIAVRSSDGRRGCRSPLAAKP